MTASRGAKMALHADRRRQSREEHSPGVEDPPHLVDDANPVRLVVGKVQQRIADNDVEGVIAERHSIGFAGLESFPEARLNPACEPRARLGGSRVMVDTVNLEAVAQEPGKVPSAATPDVQDPRAVIEPAALNLIEQVDVQVAELAYSF